MIKSVSKSMKILDYLAETGRASVKELSAHLNMPKSTVCGLAQTLQSSGYLYQDELSGDYLLSFKFFRVGSDILEKLGVSHCAMPILKQLAKVCGETVNLSVLEDTKAVYIAKIEASPMSSGIKLGARAPLHCTASGKIMLANLPEAKVEQILKVCSPLEAYSDTTICSVEVLRQELKVYRSQGYAICRNEIGNGAYSVASFISDFPAREAAALSIAGPQIKFTPERIKELAALVTSAGREISRKLKSY